MMNAWAGIHARRGMSKLSRILVHAVVYEALAILLGGAMTGCADTNTWQEEVKLLDGRIITVTQKRGYESVYTGQDVGSVVREAWLTFRLPEFGDQDITWHENLEPQVLNIYNGQLYVVGIPPTGREFMQYGKPKPSYLGYIYNGNEWMQIAFSQIPEAIYDTNLLIEIVPPNKIRHVTLVDKDKVLQNPELPKHYKRIDPEHVMINI